MEIVIIFIFVLRFYIFREVNTVNLSLTNIWFLSRRHDSLSSFQLQIHQDVPNIIFNFFIVFCLPLKCVWCWILQGYQFLLFLWIATESTLVGGNISHLLQHFNGYGYFLTGWHEMSQMWQRWYDICNAPNAISWRGANCFLHMSQMQVSWKNIFNRYPWNW